MDLAEQIVLSGPGKDSLYTGAQKINQAILELGTKIINMGGVPTIQAGPLAERPEATDSGMVYISTR